MRIVLATGIYPPDAGGPATYTRALAHALHAQGTHQVAVVCYGEPSVKADDDFPVHRISRKAPLPARYWRFAWRVYRLAKQSDVVYLQGPGSEGIPGTVGAWLAGRPTVMKVVGDYAWEIYAGAGGKELLDTFLNHYHSGKVRILEALERWSATRATKVITPSAYLKTVAEKWGVPAARITVIPNAITALPEGMSRVNARAMFSVNGKRVLLTAVRAVPWKGGAFLIALLPQLAEDIVLVIAGDGPERAHWEAMAAQKGVSERVVFVGRLDRTALANWYRAADLFVLASGYEGYPWVVAEAASVGLPSFVSDKGGNPETKERLGSQMVAVLPYENEEAWLAALRGTWPSPGQGAAVTPPTAERMLTETLHTLSTAL